MSTKKKDSPVGKKVSNDQLLNLEVKVLTQQLGTANQWAIRAEGRVAFSDLTIRVYALPKEEDKQQKGKSEEENNSIVLEDGISTETPFVGENCCIVWNSVEQQLSLCLMYASEEGYAASWSALVAMQDKTYPAFGFDLLERCSAKVSDPQSYSTIIHNEYEPPLGFIERHAISLSIIENQHYKNPAFFTNKDMMLALLDIANVDLIEYLVSSESYPLFAGSLGCEESSSSWSTPSSLTKLQLPEELVSYIVKDMNLTHLQEEVLDGEKTPEVVSKVKLLGDRLRNELACTLLASDRTLVQAKEALMVMPASNSDGAGSTRTVSAFKPNSDYFQKDVLDKMTSSKAEQQVLAHLHFFRCLVRLCITELGPDLVGPIVLKIFHCGLLEALSFVAERYALPKGLSAAFLAALHEDRGGRGGQYGRGGAPTPNAVTGNVCFNPAIEHELTCLLDATIIRLNERQEEQLMNDILRSPILADPTKYNGLMTFLFRQLLTEGKKGYVDHAISDGIGVGNPFLLFHVLGLHDDEGNMSEERAMNPNAELTGGVREKFQAFVVTKYIALATRGMLAVPSPPVGRDAPLVQFQVSNPTKTHQLPQGISSPLIRVLEYLSLLTNGDNRTALLKAAFSHKSLVLQYIEGCFAVASKNSRAIRQDVLCGNVRFLKAVIGQLMPVDSTPMLDKNSKLSGDQNISKNTVTNICRALTVERDTLGTVLQAYNEYGGHRRNSVFHSSVLSLLDLIVRKQVAEKASDEGNDLRDVRDYLYFKHLHSLPKLFAERFRQSLLAETTARLGEDTGYLGSVSVLSSVAGSELMRSSSKLRFVDEVEAATGGVDGTVEPSSVSGLSPTMVASMQDPAEDKLKKRMRATITSILGSSGNATRTTGPNAWATPSPDRPSPMSPAKGPGTKLVLKPTAPKNEKQASARPQRGFGEPVDGKRTEAGTTSPSAEDHVVLPKLKKRTGGQPPAKP